jgi:hypothetical protein
MQRTPVFIFSAESSCTGPIKSTFIEVILEEPKVRSATEVRRQAGHVDFVDTALGTGGWRQRCNIDSNVIPNECLNSLSAGLLIKPRNQSTSSGLAAFTAPATDVGGRSGCEC